MPICAPPFESETLPPTRTTSLLPLTEIMTAPPRARVRTEDAVCAGALELEPEDDPEAGAAPVTEPSGDPVGTETCWTNGSLLGKFEKLASSDLPAVGASSLLGSFELPVGAR